MRPIDEDQKQGEKDEIRGKGSALERGEKGVYGPKTRLSIQRQPETGNDKSIHTHSALINNLLVEFREGLPPKRGRKHAKVFI